jgi:hypothetical protein
MMARVPTVGAKQLHPVQLTPEMRKILAHRSRRAAHREYSPVLAADRGAFKSANRAYRTEASSVRNATGMVENQLAQALAGLSSSGLSGKYKHQVQQEFTARQQDVASAIPFLLSNAAQERTSAIQDARGQLTSDQAQMQKSGASMFNQLLKEGREAGTSALKEQAKKHSDVKTESKEAAAEVDLALTEAKRLLAAYPEEHPTTPEQWAIFTGEVAKGEGIKLPAAVKAVQTLQLQRAWSKATPFG